MNPIRIRSSWRRRAISLLALAGLCWPVHGKAAAQQLPLPTESPAPETEMQVFQVKYVPAAELVRMIQEVWGEGKGHVRVSADQRTNTVLVVANPEKMALVKRFVSAMDVNRGQASKIEEREQRFEIFPLKYTRASPDLSQTLNVATGGRGHIAVDFQRNLVIVSGDEKTLQTAGRLLDRLDRPQDKPQIAETQVRIVWLASGLAHKEAPKPPEDMKEVVAELAKIGVEDPRLVTQMVITVMANTSFQVQGSAGLQGPSRLSVKGTVLDQMAENYRLRISIDATRESLTQPPTAANQIGRLETEITAPSGHSVVLGMTPTATSTSVFVVQVSPKKSTPPATRR